jgi:hypothetical protein
MNISQEAIKEFKAIYHSEYGEELTDAEAAATAERLLRLFAILLHTPPPCADPSDAHKSCR